MPSLTTHIRRVDSHSDTTVGKTRIAGGIAHAVHYLLSTRCGRRDDDPTGTHTETEDTVTLHLGNKTICRWGQQSGITLAVILNLID